MFNSTPMRSLTVVLVLFVSASASITEADDVDTDGDGLSDFQESHKYLTDPRKKDTDGDGIDDGQWLERREYQYVVRSVVQVMRPVTVEYLNDDYQDARVLDQTETYVELEVIHYPFNRVASALTADDEWRETIRESEELSPWLEPGPTADWTPELKSEILEALKKDGIDPDALNDRETVEQVSRWLLRRAEYHDGFSCFSTAFDEKGKPFVPEELESHLGGRDEQSWRRQWEREISAAGMFRHRTRGSCSSTAIYLNGCLRAVGIPTRTILCIPVVDAGDESEVAMIRRLGQSGVRRDLLAAVGPLKGSWASHTYNEVYVGGRWRRLNYDRLGQNIHDPNLFGLMTHVATFHDWADARMHATIGRRQTLRPDDVFGGPNPYSTISLRDQTGTHCRVELPKVEPLKLVVRRVHWTDSSELPEEIQENCRRTGRFGLIADVTGFHDRADVPGFLATADLRVYMDVVDESAVEEAEGETKQPVPLGVGFDRGCYWLQPDLLRIYVPFGGGDRRDLVPGVKYRFRPRNGSLDSRWQADDVTIVREVGSSEQ